MKEEVVDAANHVNVVEAKAEENRILIDKMIEDVVDAANHVNVVEAKAEENRILINNMIEEVVDITQEEFDAMLEAGTLDPTKEYNTYEG